MLRLCVEESVTDAKTHDDSKALQALAILIHFSNAELTQAGGPGVVIDTYSGVEIAGVEQQFFVRNSPYGSTEVVIELVFCFCCGCQSWCIGTDQTDWS